MYVGVILHAVADPCLVNIQAWSDVDRRDHWQENCTFLRTCCTLNALQICSTQHDRQWLVGWTVGVSKPL